MKNSEKKIRIFLIISLITLLIVGFVPASQEETPIISIDVDALTAKIEEALSKQTDQKIADLELRISSLEEKLKAYETRITTLEKLASLPTVTPAPKGTPTETLIPTRTPNPTGYECSTELLSPYYFGQFNPGSEFMFQVRITNTGSKTWGNDVTIKYSDGLKAEVEEHYAYALPVASVAPDESIEISIPMKAPTEKKNDGKYQSYYVLNNGKEDFCEFSYSIYVP